MRKFIFIASIIALVYIYLMNSGTTVEPDREYYYRWGNRWWQEDTMFVTTTVDSTDTVKSEIFDLSGAGNYGIWAKATSTLGTPYVTLKLYMSKDTTTANFCIPESYPNIIVLDDEVPHVKSLSPPCMRYGQIWAFGDTLNRSDTEIEATLFSQS